MVSTRRRNSTGEARKNPVDYAALNGSKTTVKKAKKEAIAKTVVKAKKNQEIKSPTELNVVAAAAIDAVTPEKAIIKSTHKGAKTTTQKAKKDDTTVAPPKSVKKARTAMKSQRKINSRTRVTRAMQKEIADEEEEQEEEQAEEEEEEEVEQRRINFDSNEQEGSDREEEEEEEEEDQEEDQQADPAESDDDDEEADPAESDDHEDGEEQQADPVESEEDEEAEEEENAVQVALEEEVVEKQKQVDSAESDDDEGKEQEVEQEQQAGPVESDDDDDDAPEEISKSTARARHEEELINEQSTTTKRKKRRRRSGKATADASNTPSMLSADFLQQVAQAKAASASALDSNNLQADKGTKRKKQNTRITFRDSDDEDDVIEEEEDDVMSDEKLDSRKPKQKKNKRVGDGATYKVAGDDKMELVVLPKLHKKMAALNASSLDASLLSFVTGRIGGASHVRIPQHKQRRSKKKGPAMSLIRQTPVW